MRLFVSFVLLSGMVIMTGCLRRHDQGELKFKLMSQTPNLARTPDTQPELSANYQSLRHHLLQRSCLKCHHQAQTKLPSFENYEEVARNGDDILFYLESGCDIGSCMPPQRQDGSFSAPVPSKQVVEVFKLWLEMGFPEK